MYHKDTKKSKLQKVIYEKADFTHENYYQGRGNIMKY